MVVCQWCVKDKDGSAKCRCGDELSCDFRDLPYEKDAIIERVDQEFDAVEGMLKDIKNIASKEKRKDMVAIVADKVMGMKVMIDVLRDEFKYKYKADRNPFAFTKMILQINKIMKKNK